MQRDSNFGLTEDQLQQLRFHVHRLGVSAKKAFKQMNEVIASCYGITFDQLTTLIKRIEKEEYVDDENTEPGEHLLMRPLRLGPSPQLQASPNENNAATLSATPATQATLQPMLNVIQNQLGLIHQQLATVPNQDASCSTSIPQAAGETVVIPLVRTVRKESPPSTYHQFQKYAGELVRQLNIDGEELASDEPYESISFVKWQDLYKQEHEGKSMYQVVREQRTPEHVELWKKWESEVEELKRGGSRYSELPEQTLVRERNKVIRQVSDSHKKLAENFGIQSHAVLYNTGTGKSFNVSAGKIGKKLSKQLAKSPVTHPPAMFLAELYKQHKKEKSILPSNFDPSTKLDSDALRLRARTLMLKHLNEERARLQMESTSTFQVEKLLRPNGFNGVRLVGFEFTPKQYGSLRSAQSKLLLKHLTIPGKIRLEKVPQNDGGDVENADDEPDNGTDETASVTPENVATDVATVGVANGSSHNSEMEGADTIPVSQTVHHEVDSNRIIEPCPTLSAVDSTLEAAVIDLLANNLE
ncbi:hypothetical protein HDU99_003632 [Rhizoclosmatium hyalinum]|nr:hypothetical protein HDU99_003632 [Rhizoclosmatium hyalinum]